MKGIGGRVLNVFEEMRSEEEITGNCRVGPHRDDVKFLVNEKDARRFGSAGQQRTIVWL